MRKRPPKMLRRLLAWILPPGHVRDGLLGDLDELYKDRVQEGRFSANLWYARQLVSGAVRYSIRRLSSRALGRRMWMQWAFADQLRNVRHAGRALRRTPGFTASAVLSLALGIGANTAIFSIFHALVLQSLPVSEPGRLLVFTHAEQRSSSYPAFRHIQQHNETLDGLLAFRTATARLHAADATEPVTSTLVSGSYFEVLGVTPAAGTLISEADEEPGSGGWRGPVVVLSNDFWMRRFGGQASIIGSPVRLNDRLFTVVGVSAHGFRGVELGRSPDVFVPMMMQEHFLPGLGDALTRPLSNWLIIMARLRGGVDRRRAEAELTSVWRTFYQEIVGAPERIRRRYPDQQIALLPGHTGISGLREQYSTPLLVLVAVMGLVLLIACANVAHLLLSRAVARRREVAVRLGLGGSRSRIVFQLLTESILLAMAGGALGLLLALALRDVLLTYLPPEQSLSAPLNVPVLLFTLALAVASSLVFGIAPALQSVRVNVAAGLKGGERSTKPGRTLFRRGLVVAQVSLSLLVLIGAALFLRSLHNLLTVDTGFARENVLVASIEPGTDEYMQVYPVLIEEVRRLPGVVAASLADSPPLGVNTLWDIFIPGHTPDPDESRPSSRVGLILPDYFETMQIPMLLGRDFDERDVGSSANVMIVNETFAKHYFDGENPVGRSVGLSDGVYDIEIVGVVKDSKYTGLRENAAPMVYVPFRPGPWASRIVVHLRTAASSPALASALRQTVKELDSGAVIVNLRTVNDEIDQSVLRERLVATFSGLFGTLALLLAAIGLYGTLSYGVARRTREFGIRMAIGAQAVNIVALVLREAGSVLTAGIALGLVAAWAFGRVVGSMLFGLESADALSIGTAVIIVAGATLTAAWIPARRASRVEPTRALRQE